MKQLPFKQGRALVLALAVLAAVAMALWLGIFSQERAAASPADLTVVVTSTPASGTTLAQGSRISYVVTVATDANPGAIVPLNIVLSGASAVVATVTAAAPGPVLVGAALDPATAGNFGVVDEGAAGDTPEDGGDDALACDTVGETTLPNTGPAGPTPPAEPDNFACTSHAVGPANLTISKTALPAEGTTVTLGSTITYTLTASNAAGTTGTATNVLIRDILGTGLTYVSAAGPAVTCTHPSAQQIDCTAASITAPGGTATVTITATVAASSGALLNGAYIDPGNVITETNEDNNDLDLICGAVGEGSGNLPEDEPDNFDCTTHTGGGLPDLTITKTASPAEATGAKTGDTITYTLTVSNASGATATATNVLIRDILGTGLTYVSATGTSVTCTHTTAQQIDCTVASLAPGASATVTILATVSATSGTVFNGARVDPGSVITETNEDFDDPDYDCSAVGEGTTTATEPDNFDCTRHTLTTATPTPTPTTSAGVLLNCPLSGRWAISVWNGPSGKATGDALATCTGVTIGAAYSLDRTTNTWLKYFPGRGTDINDLLSLSSMQAIITLGQ